MAHCTHLTLFPEVSQPDTSNGESSTSAAARSHPDELPEYAESPGDHGDNLVSNEMPIYISLHENNKKEKQIMFPSKSVDTGWDVHDTPEDRLHRDATNLVDEFMLSHPSPPYCKNAITGNLPCPVIIPQRRPRDWKRGFMRAYAPVLADCSISQDTFLDFLKTFHAINKNLPWLHVINAAASQMVPIPVVTFVTSAAIDLAIERTARIRTNAFLNRMNKDFFMPRGLYCLIMTYDPKSNTTHTSVNITRSVRASMKSSSSVLGNSRLTSNRTHSIELPEAAPLVFPIMEPGNPFFNPIRWTQKILSNYFDRRAQLKYAAKNPPKALAAMSPADQMSEGQKTWLTVRAANPTPTGENIDAVSLKEREKTKGKPNKGTGRRWFKEDVLYLMIVNLPTKAELAAVTQSKGPRL